MITTLLSLEIHVLETLELNLFTLGSHPSKIILKKQKEQILHPAQHFQKK